MTRYGKPIAPSATNTVTLANIVLATHTVEPLDPKFPTRPFPITLTPVLDAYVICRQLTYCGRPAPASLPIRIGRTNGQGWVVEREEGDVHGPATRHEQLPMYGFFSFEGYRDIPARDQMLLDAAEEYELFWCYGREHFDAAYAALKKEPFSAPPVLAPHRLGLWPQVVAAQLAQLDLLDDELRALVGQHLLSGGPSHGFVRRKNWPVAPYVYDVTPPSLRALHLAEFLEWYAAQAMQKGLEHWKVLARIKNIADITAHGAPDADLDPILKRHAARGTRERRVLEHYRDFTWQCATKGLQPRPFRDALTGGILTQRPAAHAAWRIQLDRLKAQGMVHPLVRPGSLDEDGLLSPDQAIALQDYFDLYTFGAELNGLRVAQPLEGGLNRMRDANEGTIELIRQLLSGPGAHPQFLRELDLYWPSDSKLRLPLLQRYARLAASSNFKFWQPFIAYRPQDWAALSLHLKWLGAVQGGLAEALKHFFGEQLGHMQLSFREAQVALSTFYRYHLSAAQKVGGRVFEEELPALKTKVRVDYTAQSITVLSDAQRPVRFKFTQVVHGMPEEELARPRGYADGVRGKRYRKARAKQQVVSYDVEVPVDLAKARALGGELPQALETAGGALNLAVGLLVAKEQLAAGDVEAWLDLGQNALQQLDKVVAFRAAQLLAKGGTPSPDLSVLSKAGARAVGVLDSGRSMVAGYQVLYGDDSPILNELDDGREFRAIAIGAKGAIQFTTGAAGALAGAGELLVFGGVEATGFLAAAAGPLGIAFFVGGLVVVAIDVALAATERFGERVTALRTAWKEAERAELHGRREPLTAERIGELHQLINTLG